MGLVEQQRVHTRSLDAAGVGRRYPERYEQWVMYQQVSGLGIDAQQSCNDTEAFRGFQYFYCSTACYAAIRLTSQPWRLHLI